MVAAGGMRGLVLSCNAVAQRNAGLVQQQRPCGGETQGGGVQGLPDVVGVLRG